MLGKKASSGFSTGESGVREPMYLTQRDRLVVVPVPDPCLRTRIADILNELSNCPPERPMPHLTFERREPTPVTAFAAVLAAAIVLSIGVTTGTLGGFGPAAVGAVLIGGIVGVNSNGSNPLAAARTAPRTRPEIASGSNAHTASLAVSILRISGPSGPASADLPPPTVA